MRRRHRLETFWYGNFRNQHPDSLALGWETYDARPRFGTNAMGMQGRIAILSEGYSNNSFSERIAATYSFLREILSLAAEERARLKAVVAAARLWRPDSIAIRSVLAPPVMQEVVAEITEEQGQGGGGFARRRRTGIFRSIRMPVYDRFAPALQVARPAAYLLPPWRPDLAELLRRHGVVVERLSAPWRGPVEGFGVDSVEVAGQPFEGHRPVAVSGRWVPREAEIGAGWYYVTTDQRLGVFAAYLLEPASEDGFATWNFLDRELGPGREAPILRVRQPVAAPMVLTD